MTVSQYQTKNGQKLWQFRFAFHDGTGRVHRQQRGFRSKKEAEHAEVAAKAKANAGENLRTTQGTVRDFLEMWLQRVEASSALKPATLAAYQMTVHKYLVPRLGELQLRQLNPNRVSQLYADLLRDGRRQRTTGKPNGLSPKTVRNVGMTLHKALRDGVQWQVLATNPCDAVSLPRYDPPEPTGWDTETVGAFLSHVADTDPVHYALFRLMLNAGLRRGEVLGLKWENVDLVLQSVRILDTRGVVDGVVRTGTPKSRRSRRAERIDQGTVDALAHLKNLQEEVAAFAGSWPSPYVATTLEGQPIHPLTFTRTFQRYAKQAGLPRIALHDLRDTSVLVGLRAGVSLATISGRLGHADAGFTLRRYAPHLESADAHAADAVGAALDRAMQKDAASRRLHAEPRVNPRNRRDSADPQNHETELQQGFADYALEATPGIEPTEEPNNDRG